MGIYFIFIIGVALMFVRRSNASPESFFLGKRGLGPWVSALSAEASDMSGWLLMGLPGLAYWMGLSEAFWTAIGLAAGTYINWKIVARRLRVYTELAHNSFTLPSFFSNRFHDKKHILLVISSIMIILFFSIYVGAQFVTFGKLFNSLFGVPEYYTQIVIGGAALVFLYTLLGGFLGESFTDLVQGLLMIAAIVLVFVCGITAAGGFGAVRDKLSSFPRFLDIFGTAAPQAGTAQSFGPGADYPRLSIISTLAWGLGYFGMPQVLLRFMAIKSPERLPKARVIAVSWCCISLFAAVAIGIIGRAWSPALYTDGGASELIFLDMARRFFPPILAGLVLSGILGASMSSADSYMLITASSVANDLLKNSIKKNISEKSVLWIARVTMLVVTLFGLFVALSGSDSIFRIVSYAWAGLGACFGPLILFSLFWKRTTLAGAAAGMLSGGIIVVLWKNVISHLSPVLNVYELLPAFVISSAVIVLVSLATAKPSSEIEAEFNEAKKLCA
ncbi:MAG: sodium/proline symporter [Spirochaetaceae bacterium]|jgi:sodium/proline symporter|nr:sodium/proline symporter [Spirochaetaceae bacterium]